MIFNGCDLKGFKFIILLSIYVKIKLNYLVFYCVVVINYGVLFLLI